MDRTLLALLGLLLVGGQVNASTFFVDGNGLLSFCENPSAAASCEAYILGVHDTWSTLQMIDGATKNVCVPGDAKAGRLTEAVVKHLNKHPEHLHMPAAPLVVKALRFAFPCGQG